MLFDVTRALAPDVAPWPGDAPFERGLSLRRADGGSCNVGWIRSSVHNGTHVDAPFHVDDAGAAVDALPLGAFHGPCRVVRVRGAGPVGLDEVGPLAPGERLLLKTQDRVDAARFPDAFAYPSAVLADALADARVPLLGTDAPSVDFRDAKDLAVHRALFDGGVQVLENLDLTDVPEGRYTLAAFPLKLAGMDGAPVRAVLLR